MLVDAPFGTIRAMNTNSERPVGIFDSGIGGLTVLKAIRDRLPGEDLVYLGDTARLPYGTKSPATIERYADRAAARLVAEDVKLVVVACNTATAVALERLRERLHPLPVIGVVEPGATAAVHARAGGRHLVLATETTVRLGAYGRAIALLDPEASVHELASELMVALAEEGWTDGSVAEGIVGRYLELAAEDGFHAETIILGCTHFPLLKSVIARVAGDGVSIIDSAETTARVVADALAARSLSSGGGRGSLRLLATDGAVRFARVGGHFLEHAIAAGDIELVDL